MIDTRSDMEKRISEIEHARGMRCMWQEKTCGGKRLIECLWWDDARCLVMIVKDFDKPIKQGKPWPKMEAVQVFLPSDHANTWDSLTASLDALAASPKVPAQ